MTITDQEAVSVLTKERDRRKHTVDYLTHIQVKARDDVRELIEALSFAIAALSAEREPVAWEITYPSGGKTITTDAGWVTYLEAFPDHHATPLYAAPPAPTVTDDAMREKIARLINPDAFDLDLNLRRNWPPLSRKWIVLFWWDIYEIDRTYDRVDALLAALQVKPLSARESA